MGVDCRITLPPAARVRDVATVIARLTGAPIILDTDPVLSAHVDGVRLKSLAGLAECVKIFWFDGEQKLWSVLYHFEWESNPGCHGLLHNSTAQWLAIGKRLVDFFGGEIDFRDNDDIDCDYSVAARPDIHASDGEELDAFQRRLAAVEPLTPGEIEAMKPCAAY